MLPPRPPPRFLCIMATSAREPYASYRQPKRAGRYSPGVLFGRAPRRYRAGMNIDTFLHTHVAALCVLIHNVPRDRHASARRRLYYRQARTHRGDTKYNGPKAEALHIDPEEGLVGLPTALPPPCAYSSSWPLAVHGQPRRWVAISHESANRPFQFASGKNVKSWNTLRNITLVPIAALLPTTKLLSVSCSFKQFWSSAIFILHREKMLQFPFPFSSHILFNFTMFL